MNSPMYFYHYFYAYVYVYAYMFVLPCKNFNIVHIFAFGRVVLKFFDDGETHWKKNFIEN